MMMEEKDRARRRILVVASLSGNDISQGVQWIRKNSAFSQLYTFEVLTCENPTDSLKKMRSDYDFILYVPEVSQENSSLDDTVSAFLANTALSLTYLIIVVSPDNSREIGASHERLLKDPPDRVRFFSARSLYPNSTIEEAVAFARGTSGPDSEDAHIFIGIKDATLGIFHLSDLHARGWDKRLQAALLKDLKRFRSWAQERMIVVSGDLTDFGWRSQMRAAREFLFRACESAQVERERVYVCPGNHDSTARVYGLSIPLLQRKLVCFRDLFPGHSHPSPDTYSSFVAVRVSQDTTAGLFLLDSTGTGALARGAMTRDTLEWIAKASASFHKEHYGAPLIAVVHHHVTRHQFIKPETEHVTLMENGPAFLDTCLRSGVDLILHGHQHLAWDSEIMVMNKYGQDVAIIPAGSATRRRPGRPYKPHYNRIGLTSKGFVVESRSFSGQRFHGRTCSPRSFRRP